jgi:hypothetical protein
MLSTAALRPPFGVHQAGPPSGPGVRPSGVQPSSVRPSGSLVRVRLSGRPMSSPSGAQPSGVCPSARSHPVWSTSAGRWGWRTRRTAGQLSRLERVEVHVAGPLPQAAVDGPRRPGCATVAQVEWRPAGERRPRTGRGGASAGGCGRPARSPDRREGAPSLRPRRGQGSWPAREVAARYRVGCQLGLEPRLLCVVVAELHARADGLESSSELGGEDGRAAPARPS